MVQGLQDWAGTAQPKAITRVGGVTGPFGLVRKSYTVSGTIPTLGKWYTSVVSFGAAGSAVSQQIQGFLLLHVASLRARHFDFRSSARITLLPGTIIVAGKPASAQLG
jgi:hypothetical protein